MGANLGMILGGMLAGAAQGGGEAAQKSMFSMQQAQQQQDLVKMQNELDEQKQMRILEAQQTFAKEQQGALFAHQDQTLDKTQTFTSGENALNRSSEEKRTGMSTAAELEAARIHVGGTLAAERMRIAEGRRGEDKPVLIQTDSGPALMNPKTGTAAPITGADGKPLGGMKMSQVDQIAYTAAYKLANDPLSEKETRDAAQAKIDAIANKYSPGGPATSASAPAAQIPPGAAALLQKQPTLKAAFDAKYGAGASDRVLGGNTTANPFQGGAGMPGTPDPGAGTTQPPLPRPAAAPPVRPAGLIKGAANAVGTNTQAGILPGVGPTDEYGRPIIQ